MSQIRNLAIIFLVLGVIMAEFLPNINPATNLTAYSQINALPNQSELLLDFLDSAEKETANLKLAQNTINSLENLNTTPTNLADLVFDINNVLSPTQTDTPLTTLPPKTLFKTEGAEYLTTSTPEIDKPFIKDIIPPSDTPLFKTYLAGAKAWYEENGKVIVKWPDVEIFKSFDKTTGSEIDWLQDRLSYEPLDSFNALANYINNYHGEIVAETATWAFVKFPSGGFIKISKPTTSAIPFLTQK